MHGLLRKLTTAYAFTGYAVGAVVILGGVGPQALLAGAGTAGVTIPIQLSVPPLRRERPVTVPGLRRTIRELPQQAPSQRMRKPARTQFADRNDVMDLAASAG